MLWSVVLSRKGGFLLNIRRGGAVRRPLFFFLLSLVPPPFIISFRLLLGYGCSSDAQPLEES